MGVSYDVLLFCNEKITVCLESGGNLFKPRVEKCDFDDMLSFSSNRLSMQIRHAYLLYQLELGYFSK